MIIHPNKNLSSEDLILDIKSRLSLNEKVKITGLGTFYLKQMPPKLVYDFKESQQVMGRPFIKIVFKPTKSFHYPLVKEK